MHTHITLWLSGCAAVRKEPGLELLCTSYFSIFDTISGKNVLWTSSDQVCCSPYKSAKICFGIEQLNAFTLYFAILQTLLCFFSSFLALRVIQACQRSWKLKSPKSTPSFSLPQKTQLLKLPVSSPALNSLTSWHHSTSTCHTFT